MWADCLAVFGKDIRTLDGASAMALASRCIEHAPVAPDGSLRGSVAERYREWEKEWEIQRTNYDPNREDNKVIGEEDLAKLLADGELDETDFDWS